MTDKIKLICETCLSSDRLLLTTSRIAPVLKEIQYEELDNKVICWECHAIIMKFYKFKVLVKKVNNYLNEKIYRSCSKLLNSTKQNFDFEFVHNYNLYTNEVKKEIKESNIKYENDYDAIEDSLTIENYENDDKECISIIDTNNRRRKKTLKKKICSEKKKPKEIHEETSKELTQEKDQQIVLSKESMENSGTILKEESEKIQEKIFLKKDKNQGKIVTRNIVSFTNDKMPVKMKILSSKKEELDLLKEKFETIHLTDEEFLKRREEKINHPNYKKIPYKCETCVLGFTKKDNYDMHFAKKHSESIGRHVCDVCSVRFASAATLSRHRALHFTRYACSLCAYNTTAVSAALNHCRNKHALDERDRIHCKQCTAVFSSWEELSQHSRSEHVLYCKDCGEKFKGQHTLRAHRVRIHAVKREFTCEVCKRTFLTKSRFESHVVKHSQTLAQRLAYCAVCKIQYKNIQVYRSHIQNSANHAQNRYQCPECDKKFASKIYRTKHYNFYHLNKSQYKCHSCDKLFISQWRLKNHRQKHHGLPRSRDHECHHCGKKFYTSSCLAVHCSTHSSSRRHLCARCGAQYRQPAALYSHERRAHCMDK